MSKTWRVPYQYDGGTHFIDVQTTFPWEVKGLADRILRTEEGIRATFTEGMFDLIELDSNGKEKTKEDHS